MICYWSQKKRTRVAEIERFVAATLAVIFCWTLSVRLPSERQRGNSRSLFFRVMSNEIDTGNVILLNVRGLDWIYYRWTVNVRKSLFAFDKRLLPLKRINFSSQKTDLASYQLLTLYYISITPYTYEYAVHPLSILLLRPFTFNCFQLMYLHWAEY